jgi:SAM-dependent methyltransferase
MGFLSTRTWQFTYFALQLGDSIWKDKDVLDFGGNIGNILRDPNSTIDTARYWCIDVDEDSTEIGKRSYPEAHWLSYNRYCFFFNPCGIPHLRLPQIEQRFDYIIAYSVFSNTPQSDMIELVSELKGLLKSDGMMAFSFIDPHYHSWPDRYDGNNFKWRLEREIYLEGEKGSVLNIDTESLMKRAENANWLMLVNGDDLYIETEDIRPYEPERQRTCHAFYSENYIRTLFPTATILPPVNDEMQHCCIIKPSSVHSV